MNNLDYHIHQLPDDDDMALEIEDIIEDLCQLTFMPSILEVKKHSMALFMLFIPEIKTFITDRIDEYNEVESVACDPRDFTAITRCQIYCDLFNNSKESDKINIQITLNSTKTFYANIGEKDDSTTDNT